MSPTYTHISKRIFRLNEPALSGEDTFPFSLRCRIPPAKASYQLPLLQAWNGKANSVHTYSCVTMHAAVCILNQRKNEIFRE